MPAEGCPQASTRPPAIAGGFYLKAVIFANGEFSPPIELDEVLNAVDLIIAADGGTRHVTKLGRMPDLVIGDLDSLEDEQRQRLEAAGVQIRVFPANKDKSDLELALLHAKDQGASQVTMLAALCRRWIIAWPILYWLPSWNLRTCQ